MGGKKIYVMCSLYFLEAAALIHVLFSTDVGKILSD